MWFRCSSKVEASTEPVSRSRRLDSTIHLPQRESVEFRTDSGAAASAIMSTRSAATPESSHPLMAQSPDG